MSDINTAISAATSEVLVSQMPLEITMYVFIVLVY